MKKIWADRAWEDYMYWYDQDIKTFKKINKLIKEINRHPFTGTGHPEPLKHAKRGYWSRRINGLDRLVYKIENDNIEIVQCRSHYDD